MHVIANADGRLLSPGRWPWVAVAQSDDPEFVARLYAAGAVFVGNADAFSLCFTDQGTQI
ncbi:hypothetical protein [Coralliovum pocilloporae]|uniref:hypothetical protein n=1 Tax=Coralliovum pocilloporae TaxID=3066369 RepID=UPI0033071105